MTDYFTTQQAAEELPGERATIFGWCEEYPGFAVRENGKWQIPADHLRRVREGEDPAAIAANPWGAETAVTEPGDLPARSALEEAVAAVAEDDVVDEMAEAATGALESIESEHGMIEGEIADIETVEAAPPTIIEAEDAERVRRLMLQTYFCLLGARHYGSDVSAPSQDLLLGRLADNLLSATKALGFVEPGGLRAAISECGAAEEFRLLTGVRPTF